MKTTYRYLPGNDRLDRVRTTDKNGVLLAKQEILEFNAVGMPKTVEKRYRVKDASDIWKQGSTSIHYDYDDAYRLELGSRTIKSGSGGAQPYIESFKYDKVGNREQCTKNGITTDYAYNERNQLVTETTDSEIMRYAYDNNGNTRYIRNAADVALKEMQYDTLNRMTFWTDFTNTEKTVYRGAGWERASYTINGDTTNFLYDGANVVADLVADPANEGSYLGSRLYVTLGLDQNISMTDVTTGDSFYYTADRRSSITTLTDAQSAQVNAYDYSAMGERHVSTVESVTQRYGYTGRELNTVSGEQFFRYRTYSAITGSFFTRDPLGYVDGPGLNNGYFAMGLGVDPMGLELIIGEPQADELENLNEEQLDGFQNDLENAVNGLLSGGLGTPLAQGMAQALDGCNIDITINLGFPVSDQGPSVGTADITGLNSAEIELKPTASDLLLKNLIHELLHIVEALMIENDGENNLDGDCKGKKALKKLERFLRKAKNPGFGGSDQSSVNGVKLSNYLAGKLMGGTK